MRQRSPALDLCFFLALGIFSDCKSRSCDCFRPRSWKSKAHLAQTQCRLTLISALVLVVWSPFMVWAPSGYSRVAILWFRQKFCPRPPVPPCDLQPFGLNTMYTYGRLAGCPRPRSPPRKGSKGYLGQIQCTHMAPICSDGETRDKGGGGWTSHRSCLSTASGFVGSHRNSIRMVGMDAGHSNALQFEIYFFLVGYSVIPSTPKCHLHKKPARPWCRNAPLVFKFSQKLK